MAKTMSTQSAGKRSAKQRRALLTSSVVLVVVGAVGATYLFQQRTEQDGAERLRADETTRVSPEAPIAVHDGNLYFWDNLHYTLSEMPLRGGEATVRLRMPPQAVPKAATPQASRRPATDSLLPLVADDGVYFVRYRELESEQSAPRSKDAARGAGPNAFLPSTPRAGEQRVGHNFSPPLHALQVWRFPWKTKSLESMPVPARFTAGRFQFALGGETSHTLYLFEEQASRWVEVSSADGSHREQAPYQTLVRLPLQGGQPEVIARDLVSLGFKGTDKTACWETPRPYPDKQHDTVCHIDGAAVLTLTAQRIASDPEYSVAATPKGVWWVRAAGSSSTSTGAVGEQLVGTSKPHLIEPPLRRSEADTFRYGGIFHAGDRLYLCCRVDYANEAKDASQNTEANAAPSQPSRQLYLIRMNPELAGQAGFWGPPVRLRGDATNLQFDDRFVYYMREEEDKGVGFALQNLLSSSAPGVTRRTVLYRMPLL